MAPPLPDLVDDAIAEILLRVPPDEPACLVRASLVCKPRRRILADPAFLPRYRHYHRAPPLLGFLGHCRDPTPTPRFFATTAASPFPPLPSACGRLGTLDCRHGRVLLGIEDARENLVVWDPITGNRQLLPVPDTREYYLNYCAAVLCARGGCGHLNCHGGPFFVVFVGSDYRGIMDACVYSSEADAWSVPASVKLDFDMYVDNKRAVLVGDDIYFTVRMGVPKFSSMTLAATAYL